MEVEKEPIPPDDLRCKRNDGRGWRCKRFALPGKTLCDPHLNRVSAQKKTPKIKDNNNNNNNNSSTPKSIENPSSSTTPTKPIRIRIRVKPEPYDGSSTPTEKVEAMLALPVPKAVTVARAADVAAVVAEDTSTPPSSSLMRGPRVKRPNVGADVAGDDGMRGPRVKRPGVVGVGGSGDELEEREDGMLSSGDVAVVKKGPRMKRPNVDIGGGGGGDVEERENVGGGDVTVAMRGPRTKRPNVGIGADVEEGEREDVGIVSVDAAAMRGPRTKRPGNAEEGEVTGEVVRCSRDSGKGWRCGKVAKDGYAMCEDHLTRARVKTDGKVEGKGKGNGKGKGKEKEKEKEKVKDVGVVGEKRFAVEEGLPDELRCTRNDGRDWRCKRRVVDGQTLCEAHFKGIRLIDIKEANVGEKEKAVVKKRKKAKKVEEKEKEGVSGCELMVVKEEVESEKEEGMLSKLDMVADVAVAEAEGREGEGGGGEGEKEEDEEDWRCKRTDGRDWRCKRRVWNGKTMCEIHYEQGKLRQKRITVPESLKLQKGDDGERIEKRLKKKRALETLENNSDKGMKRMKAELIRVFLRREIIEQNKKGGVKSVNNSHSGEITRDLPYGLMEIPPAPPAQILENAGSLGIKVGVQSSNSVAKRRFRSKNIEPSPVGPLKVVPFAGNLGKVKNGGKKKCHWCQNSESLSLTKCLSCRKLFFCAGCIKERGTDPEEVKVKCPVCCGSCDCKTCCATRSKDASTQETEKRTPKGSKFHQLQYLITLLIPILEQINQEQNVETETEARFKGQDLSEVEIRQADVGCRDQCCCNNCKTPILDFHRSCPNCSYNLCISCCREYSQGGCLRGADNSDPQLHNVMKTHLPSLRKCSAKIDKSNSVHSNGSADQAAVDPVVPSISDSASRLHISCPPMELGGCDNSLLDLRCIFPLNWTKELEISAKETFPGLESPHSTDDTVQCSLCAKVTQAADNKKEILEASKRTKAHDNFIYCPSSSDDQYDVLDHFQIHWRKGHPIKVRNVLQRASPLSLDPLAMFCSCLENKPSNSVDKTGSEVVNCTDWYEVEIGSREYFARSLDEGCTPRQNKTLRVKAKLSSTVSRRHLGDHYSEIIHALPLQAYTNPRSGLLNIAGKLPEDFPDSKLGPHVCISFGSREVVARGELVTKLHYNSYDVVNILAHAADATCSTEHLNKISVLITQSNKQDQSSHNLENNETIMNNEMSGEVGGQVQCPERSALQNGVVGASCQSPVTNGIPAIDPQDDETTAKLQISSEVGGQDQCSERIAVQNGVVGASCCSHVANGTPAVDPQNDKSTLKLPSSDTDSDASVICSGTTNGGLDKSTDEMARLERLESSTLSNKSSSSESCGAYWDVFRRQDIPKLLEYINKHVDELSVNYDFPKNVVHPIFDGSFYLDSIHKMQLKEEFDIEPWTFNQCLGEAVFIPAGCPYQMRNVKSCVNIALGFISPENASESIKVINEIRALPNNHKAKELKLEVEKMIICSIDEAIKEIYRLKIEEAGLLENGVQISIPNS
ncbi:lysine-specific demethylase JMJ28-like [Silene latifolia]|uniref:lysine-specific demethylase JMJ28-like n=1 Tax=Silene latifolia TaxID=37657 RepID=UPI003D778B77